MRQKDYRFPKIFFIKMKLQSARVQADRKGVMQTLEAMENWTFTLQQLKQWAFSLLILYRLNSIGYSCTGVVIVACSSQLAGYTTINRYHECTIKDPTSV